MKSSAPLLMKISAKGMTFLILLAFSLQGFQWELRQATAWVQMTLSYSQEADLVTALGQTFSGDRPCSACTAITQDRMGSTETPQLGTPPPPLDPLFMVASTEPLHASRLPRRMSFRPAVQPEPSSHRTQPPTPPPRMDAC